MKALYYTFNGTELTTGNNTKLITGETVSLIIGTIISVIGIVACTWASSYQELIIKSISQTFM